VSTAAEHNLQTTLRRALRRVLRPLVRVLLRNGVDCPSVEEELRRAYVDVAMHDLIPEGRRPTQSRAATITGLSRKEVARLQAGDEPDAAPPMGQNRAATVVAGWVRDPDFQNGRGEPRPLSLEDAGGGFPALVKRYGGDVPHRTVLDELTRVGTVEVLADGRARLLSRSYVPSTDDAAKIDILGTDVGHLIETIAHNLDHGGGDARYQRKVLYDDLPAEFTEQFRAFAAERCQTLLEEFDRSLAAGDRGLNPDAPGSGRRLAGVGMFYFERNLDPADAEPDGESP
jgi:hypothetical protein